MCWSSPAAAIAWWTARPPRARAARGAGARVVARAAEPRHQRREVHRYGLRGAGGAAHGQQASRVLGPGHRPGVRPRPAPLAVSARAARIGERAPPLLQLRPGARDLPQAREGHGHGAPGGNAAELGNPFLLRSRVSLARRCDVMTVPRVTLPRVVARGLQTTWTTCGAGYATTSSTFAASRRSKISES